MKNRHINRDDEVIALLLGDVAPSPQTTGWLASDAGRRRLAAYRHVLNDLRSAYGSVASARPRRAVFYTSVFTPIGRVFVAATGTGLVRVSFRRSETAFVRELQQRFDAEVIQSPHKLKDIVTQLAAYFAGERRRFDVPVDLSVTTPFQRRVLLATRRVPAGRVVTYGDIARRIGRPAASRAVGQALGRNPVPIVIPCHRIVGGGGGLGGYTGGLDIKKKLLGIEGAWQ